MDFVIPLDDKDEEDLHDNVIIACFVIRAQSVSRSLTQPNPETPLFPNSFWLKEGEEEKKKRRRGRVFGLPPSPARVGRWGGGNDDLLPSLHACELSTIFFIYD